MQAGAQNCIGETTNQNQNEPPFKKHTTNPAINALVTSFINSAQQLEQQAAGLLSLCEISAIYQYIYTYILTFYILIRISKYYIIIKLMCRINTYMQLRKYKVFLFLQIEQILHCEFYEIRQIDAYTFAHLSMNVRFLKFLIDIVFRVFCSQRRSYKQQRASYK